MVHIGRGYRRRVFRSLIASAVTRVRALSQLDDLVELFLCEVDRFSRQVLENATPLTGVRCQVHRICDRFDLSDSRGTRERHDMVAEACDPCNAQL
jgi:hypothetical protein